MIQQASLSVLQPRFSATWVADDDIDPDADHDEYDDDYFQAHNTSWDSWYDAYTWASARAPVIRVELHDAPFLLSAGANPLAGMPTIETGMIVIGESEGLGSPPIFIGPPLVELPHEPDYGGRVDVKATPESWKPLPTFTLAETTLINQERGTTWNDEAGSFTLPNALAEARASCPIVVVGMAWSFGNLRYTFYDAGEEPVELEPLQPLEPLERLPGYYVY